MLTRTVVQQDDITGFHFLQALRDACISTQWTPVNNAVIPQHGSHVVQLCLFQHRFAQASVGRTKPARCAPANLLNAVRCARNFCARPLRHDKPRVGMTIGVVAERVPLADDAFDQMGKLLGRGAKHEETGTYFIFGKHVKNTRGMGRVRTIIKGQANPGVLRITGQLGNVLRKNPQVAREGLRRTDSRWIVHQAPRWNFYETGLHYCAIPRKNC